MNLFQIDADTTELFRAMDRAVVEIETRAMAVAKDTADRIVSNAKQRVARATGATAAGIHAEPTHDGTGYVVLPWDQRLAAQAWAGGATTREHNAGKPMWLEFGTVKMSARPFFFVSAQLEESGHDRRMREAIQDGIEASGLGD